MSGFFMMIGIGFAGLCIGEGLVQIGKAIRERK